MQSELTLASHVRWFLNAIDDAAQFVRLLDLGEIESHGGTAQGMTDFLYVRKRSVVPEKHAYYVRVYVNAVKARRVRGGDLDVEMREQAKGWLAAECIVRARHDERLAWLRAYCRSNLRSNRELTVIAMLCLGNGAAYAWPDGSNPASFPLASDVRAVSEIFAEFARYPQLKDDRTLDQEFFERLPALRARAYDLFPKLQLWNKLSKSEFASFGWLVYCLAQCPSIQEFVKRDYVARSMSERILQSGRGGRRPVNALKGARRVV